MSENCKRLQNWSSLLCSEYVKRQRRLFNFSIQFFSLTSLSLSVCHCCEANNNRHSREWSMWVGWRGKLRLSMRWISIVIWNGSNLKMNRIVRWFLFRQFLHSLHVLLLLYGSSIALMMYDFAKKKKQQFESCNLRASSIYFFVTSSTVSLFMTFEQMIRSLCDRTRLNFIGIEWWFCGRDVWCCSRDTRSTYKVESSLYSGCGKFRFTTLFAIIADRAHKKSNNWVSTTWFRNNIFDSKTLRVGRVTMGGEKA